ncbi:MAG: peptide ABC transporter substrate-binding protein [Coriobacteriia bacterium]|nr:peptide ABC transporter substrate-binding protein [Coriobacteriia bacterium]
MQKYKLSKLFVLALAIVALFALAGLVGCTDGDTNGGGDTATEDRSGGIFRMYLTEPRALDPYLSNENQGLHVIHALFTPLIKPNLHDPAVIEPAAALSWEINEDATVFTFNLDPDARFANNTPVTAEDFVFAFNRIANPNTVDTLTGDVSPSPIAGQLSSVTGFDDVQAGDAEELEGLVALDEHTLEITLDEPFGDFIQNLMHTAMVPVLRDLVENGVPFDGDYVPFGEMPIGNGPFMMDQPWQPVQFISTVQNPYYVGEPAYVDGIYFDLFEDVDAAFVEWQAGGLDLAQISSGQLIEMQERYGIATDDNGYTANPGSQVISAPFAGVYFILINNTIEPFDNPDLRRALSLAINREAINDLVWESSYMLATDVLTPGIPGFQEGAWEDSHFDREAAIVALADAGFPGGEGLDTITLSLNAGAGHEEIMELIQQDFAAIGITAQIDGMEWGTYLDALEEHNYDMGRLGWIASYPSTDYFLYELFSTGNMNNFTGFSDAEVDEALIAVRAIGDPDERAAEYQRINQLIQVQNPLIPIAYYAHRMITSDRMNNVTINTLDRVDYKSLWISADAR